MPVYRGRLLLLLTSRAVHTLTQLSAADATPAATLLRDLQPLIAQGYVLAATDAGVTIYHLAPKVRASLALDPAHRVLVLEDDLSLQRVTTMVLEAEGYAVIATALEADALALLDSVSFDLVLTDSLSRNRGDIAVASAGVRAAAGATPVALFTAHQLELDAALAMGFQELISKPFTLERFEGQIRQLLRLTPPRA
jgi:CheY-like chemotaxis protein